MLNRADISHLSDAVPDTAHVHIFEMANSLVLSQADDEALQGLLIIHMSRIIATVFI